MKEIIVSTEGNELVESVSEGDAEGWSQAVESWGFVKLSVGFCQSKESSRVEIFLLGRVFLYFQVGAKFVLEHLTAFHVNSLNLLSWLCFLDVVEIHDDGSLALGIFWFVKCIFVIEYRFIDMFEFLLTGRTIDDNLTEVLFSFLCLAHLQGMLLSDISF